MVYFLAVNNYYCFSLLFNIQYNKLASIVYPQKIKKIWVYSEKKSYSTTLFVLTRFDGLISVFIIMCCLSAIPMAFSKYHLHVEFFLVGKWHFPKTTWRKLHYINLTVAMTKHKTVNSFQVPYNTVWFTTKISSFLICLWVSNKSYKKMFLVKVVSFKSTIQWYLTRLMFPFKI